MQRKVAKVKDGNVGKKDKGDGKVVVVGKRGRKMRGGGETFKQYCEEFVKVHKGKFDEAKSFVKDMFNNLYYAIYKIDIKGKWGSSTFVTNAEKVNRRDALQIIFKILKKTNDDDEEEAAVKGIQGIDNKDLITLLNYININKTLIITSYNKLKIGEPKDIKGLDGFYSAIMIDEDNIKKLFQNILFLKIYKLFSEFKDISAVEIISNIQIEKAGDKGNGLLTRTREGSIDTMENQSSVYDNGWNEGITIHTNGDWFNRTRNDDREANARGKLSKVENTDRTPLNFGEEGLYAKRVPETANGNNTEEDIDKILKSSIDVYLKEIVLDKTKTLFALKNVFEALKKTKKFMLIEKKKTDLKKNSVVNGWLIAKVDELITITYNDAAKLIDNDKEVNLVVQEINATIEKLSPINVKKEVSSITTKKTISLEDTDLITSVGELANITNLIYITILKKYLAYLNKPSISDDEESGDDEAVSKRTEGRNIVNEINAETIGGDDDSKYKKLKRIMDNLTDTDELYIKIKQGLNKIFFDKINKLTALLQSSTSMKKNFEDFLNSVEDANIFLEVNKEILDIKETTADITEEEETHFTELFKHSEYEIIRLFGNSGKFRMRIEEYMGSFKQPTELVDKDTAELVDKDTAELLDNIAKYIFDNAIQQTKKKLITYDILDTIMASNTEVFDFQYEDQKYDNKVGILSHIIDRQNVSLDALRAAFKKYGGKNKGYLDAIVQNKDNIIDIINVQKQDSSLLEKKVQVKPKSSLDALVLSSLNSLPELTDKVKISYGKIIKDQLNRIIKILKQKIKTHIDVKRYKSVNTEIIIGTDEQLKQKLDHFTSIARKSFMKFIRDAFKILSGNNNDDNILKKYNTSLQTKIEFLDYINKEYGLTPANRLSGVKSEEIIDLIFSDIYDIGSEFHTFCHNTLKKAFSDVNITWSTRGGQSRGKSQKQQGNQQNIATTKDPEPKEHIKKPTKNPANELVKESKLKNPKTNEPIKTPKAKEPTKTPKQKEPTKTPKQKEPTKTPKQKEPTKTLKAKEPIKFPNAKELKPNKPTKK
jgi:hypothetical protein